MRNLFRSAAAFLGSMSRGARLADDEVFSVGDNLMNYPKGEVRFAEARRRAHATLPRFFELAKAGLHGVYLVKMRLEGGGEVDNIWVEVTGMRNGAFQGRLANDPIVPGFSEGDAVELAESDINDWMINTGRVRYGGYTVRAMLDDMPPAQAEELRRQFRE